MIYSVTSKKDKKKLKASADNKAQGMEPVQAEERINSEEV